MKKSELRTPLARVRGLGSAKDGTSHFIWQRITALVLIPLSIWFVYSLLCVTVSGNHDKLVTWLSSSLVATALMLMLVALFYHAKLGLQVIIEDYVHGAFFKYTLLLANIVILYGFAAISIMAVLKLHFFGLPPVDAP